MQGSSPLHGSAKAHDLTEFTPPTSLYGGPSAR